MELGATARFFGTPHFVKTPFRKNLLPVCGVCDVVAREFQFILRWERDSRSMGLQFVLTSPSEQPALLRFLLEIYHADPDLNSFRPEVLQWKYFAPHPDWNGPRSFLLKRDERIIAHGGAWPIRLAVSGAELKAIHLVDWAASRIAPGAGIQVLRSISAMADLMVTIGGSRDTKNILPKLGYKSGGALKRYVRVVRPWLQLRTSRQHNWKTPLRFLRNAVSSFKTLPPTQSGWQASSVPRFETSLEQVLETRTTDLSARSLRTAAALNYMLDCPAAQFSGFIVSEAKQLRGYFVLVRVGRQARIVDIQIDGRTPDQWRSVCTLAAHAACQDPEICEVIAGTSRKEISEGFEQIGFWPRRVDPIYYYDARNLLAPGTLLELNLIDGDLSFFYNPEYPYVS